MNTLLLRLSGPMQSWGTQSNFDVRDTGYEPSKSGVIGLLCAALGRPRLDPLDDLARFRMGVRVDREGRLAYDYHTAGKGGYFKGDGKVESKTLIQSRRYYLADAIFLVGLASDDLALLGQLHTALRDPVWPLYLGRKAFVPGDPIWLGDGLRDGETVETALESYPWLGHRGEPPRRVRLVLDDPNGEAVRQDLPISFAERRFQLRRVRTTFVSLSSASQEG